MRDAVAWARRLTGGTVLHGLNKKSRGGQPCVKFFANVQARNLYGDRSLDDGGKNKNQWGSFVHCSLI